LIAVFLLAFVIGIAWADLPPSWRERIAPDEKTFGTFVRTIDNRTMDRVREGEWDHLIYYLLQSQRFTALPPVEPALSAREFHEAGRVPETVTRRVDEFLARAVAGGPEDERLEWARHQAAGADRERLLTEYRRAMKFLYEKEWEARDKDGAERREFVARLYRDRGHSTDTNAAAAETLSTGLAVLRELYPGRALRDVLIIGPGIDLAPRTGFDEKGPPRSYQMEMLPGARCADVNPRVVKVLGCEQLNVITQRMERKFDLIVVTNVFLYFDDKELALALANIREMLTVGGFLIHNELRPEAERLCRDLQMPVVHARTIEMTGTSGLYDAVVIHRRAAR
jgi:hypothetical protein